MSMCMCRLGRKVALPTLPEEVAVVYDPDGLAETKKLLGFDSTEFVDRGDLESGHDTGELPASIADVGEDGFEDGALDDGTLEEGVGLVCAGKEVADDVGCSRARPEKCNIARV